MPTVSNIIIWAQTSQYLTTVDIARSGLFGGGIDVNLPRKIYCIRKNIEWLYDLDPTNTTLIATSNYLYALLGKYGLEAQNISGSGSISPVAPVTPIIPTIYPFMIKSSDLQPDGVSYDNPLIIGDTLALFINEYGQQWYVADATQFVYTATGFRITLPGFDGILNDYHIMIDKLNS